MLKVEGEAWRWPQHAKQSKPATPQPLRTRPGSGSGAPRSSPSKSQSPFLFLRRPPPPPPRRLACDPLRLPPPRGPAKGSLAMDAHGVEDDENFLALALQRVDLDIEFGFEKLLNLEMLAMDIASRAVDLEPLLLEPHSVPAESVAKLFEFDALHTIVDSEINELERLAASIQTDIGNAETKQPGTADKLRARKDSLRQMQDLISAVRTESATFDKAIRPSQGDSEGAGCENGHMSGRAAMQAEDQRNVLQMLQQSIACKLDFENKLRASQSLMEDLRMKLRHAEQESYLMEESIGPLYEGMLAAENACQFYLGTSRELLAKIDTYHLYSAATLDKEGELQSKLEESFVESNAIRGTRDAALGDTGNKQTTQEFLNLRNKLCQLEVCISRRATEAEKSIIDDIRAAISSAESRAQNAEARCAQLTQTNAELNGELNSLRSQGSDRAGLLETRLMESDTQLEHARASVDAIVEQQGMLRSSISDMEQMIEDLKEKYLKAEARAENAESKCSLLTDTNLELSEELSFLRGRVEGLENSLHHANQLKVSTAKDIGSKTKTITDLVAKLAMERERLHVQIVTLTKKNRLLAQKCKVNVNEATLLSKNVTTAGGELRPNKVTEEAALSSSPTQTKVMPAGDTAQEVEDDEATPAEDESAAESMIGTVQSIEPTLLNWKCISSIRWFPSHHDQLTTGITFVDFRDPILEVNLLIRIYWKI
ncbi:hypothetical protein U9M48_021339 [Paspalum notatum var. saurae]|uniref:WIT1/2 N-terminal helical bundle domain-containing protein n=1 Tax=Paspalum notatum var. saurae TaxID=547442 RepID=A0AAQ3TFE5_PASNO